MKFFISDTHFSHSNIIKFCNRPFLNSLEMDEKLIENWNNVVKFDDTVYHLGDFAMRCPAQYFHRLNGRKILIIGNHDNRGEVVKYFDEVYNSFIIKIGDNEVNLNHYPYKEQVGPHDRKFLNRMMKDDGRWLLHGHTHNSSPQLVNKSINVCVEHWNYTPIPETSISEIISRIDGKIKNKGNVKHEN